MIDYTLIRSSRKTLAIHITKEAAVTVRAPLKLKKADIDRFVSEKENWILKTVETQKWRLASRINFSFNYGDKVKLCGKEYFIRAKQGNRVGFDGESFYIPPDLSCTHIKEAVIKIYKLAAKKIFNERVLRYSALMGVTPTAVKINSAKTRWGSCSGKNSLNFSWRLAATDEDLIDYVVVHELAHIKEHNHSANFWATVAKFMPDFAERRHRLKSFTAPYV